MIKLHVFIYIANLDCHDLNVSALAALAPPITSLCCQNTVNFHHGLIFVNFRHTKKYQNLFRTCACNAIRNYIAQARMPKLNPAGNKKILEKSGNVQN